VSVGYIGLPWPQDLVIRKEGREEEGGPLLASLPLRREEKEGGPL